MTASLGNSSLIDTSVPHRSIFGKTTSTSLTARHHRNFSLTMHDLQTDLTFAQHAAPSPPNEVNNPPDLSALYLHTTIADSLAAPVQGSSLTSDLHHLARLLALRINADNDARTDTWLDLEIEERILLIQSYDPEYITTQILKLEAEKGLEELKAARNALRYCIPEGVNEEVEGVIELVDGLVMGVEEEWNKAFWVDARRKLEGLGR